MNIQYKRTALKKDAFIIEGGQAGTVSLVKNEKPLLLLSLIHRYLVCGHANQKMFHLYV